MELWERLGLWCEMQGGDGNWVVVVERRIVEELEGKLVGGGEAEFII